MKFKIHKEGYMIIAVVFLLLASVTIFIEILFPVQTVYHLLYYLASLIFYVFVVRFFRAPIRQVIPDDQLILSGADGKVVVIEEVEEKEYFKTNRIQVSIFMSPIDVHINWYPLSGTIKYYNHIHGFYFIASHPKSSHENERTTIVVENKHKYEIMFRQIAGTVARRIVCLAKKGKEIKQGDELGIIKFGSRFDIFLPLDAKVQVKLGQKVIGCETIIATIPAADH